MKNTFEVLRELRVAGCYPCICRYSDAYNFENFTNFKKSFQTRILKSLNIQKMK